MWILDKEKNIINLDQVVEIRRDGRYIIAIDTTKTWHYLRSCDTEAEAVAFQDNLISIIKSLNGKLPNVLNNN